MLEIIDINKHYGSLHVLKDVNLTIGEKEIVTILGPSGAGKTTLLQIAGTLDTPDSGRILYDGEAVQGLSDKKLSAFRNSHIGFIFQFHLSGGERQRTAVARALVNNPRVVFADEPTGSLDSRNRDEIQELFSSLRDSLGQTFVIVTHDPSLSGIADRTIHMADGRVVLE